MYNRMVINETTILVAEFITTPFSMQHEISNFALIKGVPVFADRCKNLHGLSVEEYKRSHLRGLFMYVTHSDVIRCNMELLRNCNRTNKCNQYVIK